MTTATMNGKRVQMAIEEKAKLLHVSRVSGEAGFVVASGSDSRKSYRVSEDCSRCNCDAYGRCSHRLAAEAFRAQEQRRGQRQDVYEYCAYCFKPYYPKFVGDTTCGACKW